MEEHESEVLQVECGMECSLLGKQEQRHSAGKFSHSMHNQMQTKQKLLQTSQDN